MKVLCKGMEIECTPDEFEELVTRGLIGEIPEFNPDKFAKDWNKLSPEKQDESPFETVAVYGCVMPKGKWPSATTTDTRMEPMYGCVLKVEPNVTDDEKISQTIAKCNNLWNNLNNSHKA